VAHDRDLLDEQNRPSGWIVRAELKPSTYRTLCPSPPVARRARIEQDGVGSFGGFARLAAIRQASSHAELEIRHGRAHLN